VIGVTCATVFVEALFDSRVPGSAVAVSGLCLWLCATFHNAIFDFRSRRTPEYLFKLSEMLEMKCRVRRPSPCDRGRDHLVALGKAL
jgi:hypothetical protein